MNNKEGLRFDSAESADFMGTQNTKIDIGGRSIVVSGKNETGKSRFINLLLSGLDPKNQPTEIISTGKEKAYTKVVIAGELNGEREEYQVEMFFTPKNRSGRLVLWDKDNNKVNSPASILKSMIGNISFDMFKFLNDTKLNKIKILKELSGVRVEIDKNELARKTVFDKRTALNNVIDRDETLMGNHGLTPEEIDKYSEGIDTTPIEAELNEISPKITNWNRIKNGTAEFKKEIDEEYPKAFQKIAIDIDSKLEQIEKLKNEILDLETEADEKRESLKTIESNYNKGVKWLENNPEPNAQEISTRLSAANVHNTNHEKVKTLAEKQKTLLNDKQQAMKYTSEIEALDNAKDKMIANSKLPIKGLSFSDSDVFYNGLPLEENQINTATLYEIGYEIAKALNPKLRVIFIKSASLFDKKHLASVMKKAQAEGYQVIAELVTESNDLEIKFVESEGE